LENFHSIFTDYTLSDLVKGSPFRRRDFLNHVLIFTDKTYYTELLKYYAYLQKEMNISKMVILQ